jgi:hypothetical protein
VTSTNGATVQTSAQNQQEQHRSTQTPNVPIGSTGKNVLSIRQVSRHGCPVAQPAVDAAEQEVDVELIRCLVFESEQIAQCRLNAKKGTEGSGRSYTSQCQWSFLSPLHACCETGQGQRTWYNLRPKSTPTRLKRTAEECGASRHALSYTSSASLRFPSFSRTFLTFSMRHTSGISATGKNKGGRGYREATHSSDTADEHSI